MYSCAILAGGGKDSVKLFNISASSKGAIPILGRPMVEYVLEAVRSAKKVNKILYVGDLEVLSNIKIKVDYSIPDTGDLFFNLINALEFFKENLQVLIVTSDIPLIKGYMLDDFLSRCDRSAVFCYSFVRKEDSEKLFPKAHRTYVRLREGSFTGGNIMLVSPSYILKNKELIEKIISSRKNPFGLAKIIGWGTIVRYIIGNLDIPTLESRASKILGGKTQAVLMEYPEIGFDVDNQNQLGFVEERLVQQTL